MAKITGYTPIDNINISFCNRFRTGIYINNRPEAFTLTWLELVEFIQTLPTDENCVIQTTDRTTLKKDKELSPYLCATVFGNDGVRKKDNATTSEVVWLDCDDISKQEYIKLRDETLTNLRIEALLYTTASHTEDAPRFRIIFPLSVSINTQDYSYVWKKYCALFPNLTFDESKKTNESVMFLPVGIMFKDGIHYVPTVKHYKGITLNTQGMVIDAEHERIRIAREKVRYYSANTQQPGDTIHPYAKKAVENQLEELKNTGAGNRNNTAFRVASCIAGYEKGGWLPGHTYWNDYEATCRQIGLGETEWKSIMDRQMKHSEPKSPPPPSNKPSFSCVKNTTLEEKMKKMKKIL